MKLRVGSMAYLDIALDPAVRRICLIDAPAVLPPATRQEVLDSSAVGLVREVLQAAVDQGALAPQPLESLTHVLLAALHHHQMVAHAGHVGAAGGGVAEDERDRRDARGR